jgi:hypothetical protein
MILLATASVGSRSIDIQVSQKCQYTLRALFELAKRRENGPLSAAGVAGSRPGDTPSDGGIAAREF